MILMSLVFYLVDSNWSVDRLADWSLYVMVRERYKYSTKQLNGVLMVILNSAKMDYFMVPLMNSCDTI